MIGTILLFLPISLSGEGSLSLTNAFFISTSAVTITGLSPVANLSIVLSPFGKNSFSRAYTNWWTKFCNYISICNVSNWIKK